MYLSHFGMRELPFSITPDTEFFFGSATSRSALNTLLIAIGSGEGFIKITGDVGTGKTLLCRKLLASLGPSHQVIWIPNPSMSPNALREMVLEQLQASSRSGDQASGNKLMDIQQALLASAASGQRTVVCIDEAQTMPLRTLESLRLLSNLETEKNKLIQIVLFGQPELDLLLDHTSVRQIKQRIVFSFRLSPLGHDEVGHYLQARLKTAGYEGAPLFSRPASMLLAQASRRVPRLVNILAHKSLLAAYGKGHSQVHWGHVLSAIQDTASALQLRHVLRLLMLSGLGVSVVLAGALQTYLHLS